MFSNSKNFSHMNHIKHQAALAAKNFEDWVENFFNRGLTEWVGPEITLSRPAVNVREEDSRFLLEVAAPGLEKGDFKVVVENGQLVVSASRRTDSETREGQYARREFNFASFRRSFTLPENVVADNIKARYENGILHIELPKQENDKSVKTKTVEIG